MTISLSFSKVHVTAILVSKDCYVLWIDYDGIRTIERVRASKETPIELYVDRCREYHVD